MTTDFLMWAIVAVAARRLTVSVFRKGAAFSSLAPESIIWWMSPPAQNKAPLR